MSTSDPNSRPAGQPSEEELRAAYEEEIKKVRVEQVLLEHVVTLVNLGMRRTGLAPGTEGERDARQVQLAIESVRVLLPVIETVAAEHVKPIRDALSQLQLAYVRIGGQAQAGAQSPQPPDADLKPTPDVSGAGVPPEPASPPDSEGPGPAQRSGRLWIPGQ